MRNPVVNVTPQYQNPFDREIAQLPEEKLQLIARNIGRELDALPDLSRNRVSENRTSISAETLSHLKPSKGKYRMARGIGKALKHSVAGYSQDELNRRIRDGLRQQFNEENTDLAIFQAFQIRQSKQPDANRPELYELYETGEIDEALSMMGKSWHIGRPKR